jgi:hypothetical protein
MEVKGSIENYDVPPHGMNGGTQESAKTSF